MDGNELNLFRLQMRQLQQSMGWIAKSDAACCGITVAQCHVLQEIGDGQPLSMKELASKLNLDISTVSRTIETMARDSLVERKPSSSDKRYIELSLSPRGVNKYESIISSLSSFYTAIFSKVPQEKRNQILESILLLNKAMDDIDNMSCCSEELI